MYTNQSCNPITKNGIINRGGLIQISREAARKVGDEDLYVKAMVLMERIWNDPAVLYVKSGREQSVCSWRLMISLISTRYFDAAEMIASGFSGALIGATFDLKNKAK